MIKTNFGGFPSEYSSLKTSKIVLLPVPYDKTSTWIKGADKGPDAILEASPNLEFYDLETDSEVFKRGIFTDKPVTEDESPEKMVKAVKERIKAHLKNSKFVATIGGNHSVSIGAFAAHSEQFKDLCILQLDAHSDLRDEYEGSKLNHACAMARAKEFCPIVQVGIRSMDICEKSNMNKNSVFFAKDIYQNTEWIKKVIPKLSKKVYLTIDLDVFDPSLMPSTGTPEPGGLQWYPVIELIKEVIKQRELVGFDIVELCPNPNNKGSDFMAAKLVYTILTHRFLKN